MLRLEALTVRYGGRPVVDAVDLAVDAGETVCVLGPSGSGKSTLLRAVAGLAAPDGGRVLLGGRDQEGIPPHRRGVGLMFQDHQLFPQHDVAANVGFGLRVRGTGREERGERVARLLDMVGLVGAERRAVTALSGGEQQRVALARALAPGPRLLMLDEPLGQLDRGLRERLVVELRSLFRRLGTTVLAVTHDQGEAFALADRVVVMRDGRVEQTGSPVDVWSRPVSEFVARFLGFSNVVPATLTGTTAQCAWGAVEVAEDAPDGPVGLLVRPGGVRLSEPLAGHDAPASGEHTAQPGGAADTTAGRDALPGLGCVVKGRTFRGDHVVLHLDPERGPDLEATCSLRAAPAEGAVVRVRFDPEETVLLPPTG
ncbi:ABC transporter ATP-binding protein [Streptomyces lonarensis]|uniref:ABC-type quaternary amine transporter n=1 Tax=Streptomyces lonarensis TaxID=700599 RepID=A0A7X6CZ98_9ACTN|nr:ABC transporter ATP-binding protein [Streptomyces lonarensis]NJQ05301.1 ABC transporter ATP-binding protein [Streptomyces lonarensis]